MNFKYSMLPLAVAKKARISRVAVATALGIPKCLDILVKRRKIAPEKSNNKCKKFVRY
jgi:hypothetical protein